MQLEITSQEKQPLLHRTVITCNIKNEKTPTRIEVKELLSAKLGANKELLFLTAIKTNFGRTDFVATARLYENKNFANTIESKYIKKRNEIKETSADETKTEVKKDE